MRLPICRRTPMSPGQGRPRGESRPRQCPRTGGRDIPSDARTGHFLPAGEPESAFGRPEGRAKAGFDRAGGRADGTAQWRHSCRRILENPSEKVVNCRRFLSKHMFVTMEAALPVVVNPSVSSPLKTVGFILLGAV